MVLTKEKIFSSKYLIEEAKKELQRRIWLKESLENRYEVCPVPLDISSYDLNLWGDEIGLEERDKNQDDPSTDASLTWEEFLDPDFDPKILRLLAAKKEAEEEIEKQKKDPEFLLYQKLKKKFEGK